MSNSILRTYNISRKFQIFPDNEQKQMIENTFGCCRFMWNKLLEESAEMFFDPFVDKLRVPTVRSVISANSFLDISNTNLKIDREAMCNERMFLNHAFQIFFQKLEKIKPNDRKYRKDGKPVNFPRFKDKRGRQSYSSYNAKVSCRINWDERLIRLPVIGWMPFSKREKKHPDNWRLRHITVSRSTVGKYYVAICYEYDDDREGLQGVGFIMNPKTELRMIGLDYSFPKFYVDSDGKPANNPKFFRQAMKHLRVLNKQLHRRKKFGKNWYKTLQKIKQYNERIRNRRLDYLHKLSSSITKNYDVVAVEDLNLENMGKHNNWGVSTYDNGFGIFRVMLQYKQDRIPYHILVTIDRWFPSTKACSVCGHIGPKLELEERTFHCKYCGHTMDRDWNAAINIRNEAFRMVNSWNNGRFVMV